jgi:hypothetical protein
MKIYLFMCLNDVIGDRYYTNEDEVKKLVEEANEKHGGDFWCKTLTSNEEDYRKMAKSFIGETIRDFFCNGFFGSRTFDMTGAEITKVYDSDDDNAIVIEVRKLDGKYDYGYFEDSRRDWQSVYEHLQEWTSGDSRG